MNFPLFCSFGVVLGLLGRALGFGLCECLRVLGLVGLDCLVSGWFWFCGFDFEFCVDSVFSFGFELIV